MSASKLALRFRASAATFGWELPDASIERMFTFVRAVLSENETLNLTRVGSFEDALERHLVDSLAFGRHVALAGPPKTLLDLGTGGGFPGVVLAAALPFCRVHLVDGRRKKLLAASRAARVAGIENIECHHGALRELLKSSARECLRASFDAVTVRAVGKLKDLVTEAWAALRPEGVLVCWKSQHLSSEERSMGDAEARRFHLQIEPDIEYQSFAPGVLVRYRRPVP